ncbi:MAG: YicC family protein [Clostridia bacterium]|nr:YicC family protein [Clostridia bacterium]
MIKSMTAYGRGVLQTDAKDVTVEIKSVNNRFFDCNIKLPRVYSPLEEKIRSLLQSAGLSRGKVDVSVILTVKSSEGVHVMLDRAYADSYLAALRDLRDSYGLTDDISTMTVAANRDVFTSEQPTTDTEKDWEELRPVVLEAYAAFSAMREAEGGRLRADLLSKKDGVKAMAEKVKLLSEASIAGYRDRLEARLRRTLDDLDIEIDEARILTECAIFADKVAIDEELVRLDSHFSEFEAIMNSDEPVGRKLDFLLQEMNRETNTIGSKCSDADIAHIVVDMKAELEKIREQIQNIE